MPTPPPTPPPAPAPPVPDPNQALAQALTALTQVLQQQQAQAQPTPATPMVLNLFDSHQPFDLSTRAGSTAYATACAALDQSWDGNAETFPPFTIALQLRAREVGWSRTGTANILTINNNNLLTDYHQIDFAQVEAQRTGRTDSRAIQNARAMYHCLKSSIAGDLKTILFEQEANLPNEDGPELFFKLTQYSVSSSIALSMSATQRLIHYDPSARDFNIADINSDLLHLFTMARTPGSVLTEPQKLHYALSAYSKIHQPESWAGWINDQIESIEQGNLVDSQNFMNAAILKQQRIRRAEGAFNGSLNTIRDDVVAMVADAKKSLKVKAPSTGKTGDDQSTTDNKRQKSTDSTSQATSLPPFIKHFKASSSDDAKVYKVGDAKEWKGEKWYFCDCPNHRNKAKWHVHEAKDCKLRKKWLDKGNASPSPTANVAENGNEENEAEPSEQEDTNNPSAMLATVMNSVGYNAAAQNYIAEAINALRSSAEE